MKRFLLGLTVVAFYLLHQDFWFWNTVDPMFFGFLPVGLFYHLCYTLAVSVLMWLLVKHAWPVQLEKSAGEQEIGKVGENVYPPPAHSPSLAVRSAAPHSQPENREDPHN
jgi:hypothetical protein